MIIVKFQLKVWKVIALGLLFHVGNMWMSTRGRGQANVDAF